MQYTRRSFLGKYQYVPATKDLDKGFEVTADNYDSIYRSLNSSKRAEFEQEFGSLKPSSDKPTAANGFGLDFGQDTEADTIRRNMYEDSQNTRTREQIRKDILSEYQGQINSINTIYDQMVSAEKAPAENRRGMTRATVFRGGLGGSPRGSAQLDKTDDYNRSITDSINQRRELALTNVYSKVNETAARELDKQEEARLKGAESWADYLSTKQERKKENALTVFQSLLDQGLTPEELDDQTYKDFAQTLGMSVDSVKNIFKGEYQKMIASKESEGKTADIKEYEYLVNSGQFTGSYMDFLKQTSAATRAPSSRVSPRTSAGGDEAVDYYAGKLLSVDGYSAQSIPQALRIEAEGRAKEIEDEIDAFIQEIMAVTDIQITPEEEDIILEELTAAFPELDPEWIKNKVAPSFNTYSAYNPFEAIFDYTGGNEYNAKGAKKAARKVVRN